MRHGQNEFRIKRNGMIIDPVDRDVIFHRSSSSLLIARLKIEDVGFGIIRGPSRQTSFVLRVKRGPERARNLDGEFALQANGICQSAIVTIRPELMIVTG